MHFCVFFVVGVLHRRGILRSLGKPLCRPHWIHYHCPQQSLVVSSARNSGDPSPPPPVIFYRYMAGFLVVV
jgi:hypothetical protein